MTREERIHRHARRYRDGARCPCPADLARELKCGSHEAIEARERIVSLTFCQLLHELPHPNPEPIPDWIR